MRLPYQWQPKVVSTQVAVIGNFVIAGVPGEFTTMSGRRLRDTVKTAMSDAGQGEADTVVAGLCNTYSDYIATPEEYQVYWSIRMPVIKSSSYNFCKFIIFSITILDTTVWKCIDNLRSAHTHNLSEAVSRAGDGCYSGSLTLQLFISIVIWLFVHFNGFLRALILNLKWILQNYEIRVLRG